VRGPRMGSAFPRSCFSSFWNTRKAASATSWKYEAQTGDTPPPFLPRQIVQPLRRGASVAKKEASTR
jgi:hypothetical protein